MLTQWLTHFSLDRATPLANDNPLKPVIGVSACLLGRPVRYNGETKSFPELTERLLQHVQMQEFCPEVGIGLPVPRPPIQAVAYDDGIRIVGVEQPEDDFTVALTGYANSVANTYTNTNTLHGFVLKARSPSCAVDSAPLMDKRGEQIGVTSGQFSHTLQQRFPCMPICDESALPNNEAIDAFLLCVYLYQHWHTALSLVQTYQWRDALFQLSAAKMDNSTRHYLMHYIERLTAHSQ